MAISCRVGAVAGTVAVAVALAGADAVAEPGSAAKAAAVIKKANINVIKKIFFVILSSLLKILICSC